MTSFFVLVPENNEIHSFDNGESVSKKVNPRSPGVSSFSALFNNIKEAMGWDIPCEFEVLFLSNLKTELGLLISAHDGILKFKTEKKNEKA